VPFFLHGGFALATGIGTDLESLPAPRGWFVLVTPPLVIERKTAQLYAGLTAADFTAGRLVREIARGRVTTGDRRGENVTIELPNAFRRQLLQYDAVRYAYDALRRAGAEASSGVVSVSVSGAGPTVYALTRVLRDARRLAEQLPDDVGAVHIVHSVGPHSTGRSIEVLARALRGQAAGDR
jgi:4-diphosphocytidyl-2C-methyl-D-erythritol kinase